MAAKKTQAESEAAAKVYQLDAIEARVKGISDQMNTGFARVNNSIETLLLKSETQVTPQQLADNISGLKINFESSIRDEIEKIHLEYGPLKSNLKWLLRAVGGQAIVIVGQILFILYVVGG